VMSKAETDFDRTQKIWDTSIGWRFPNPRMQTRFPLLSMGETAEEVADQYKISRQEQDEFAFHSHQKACQAIEQNLFKDEILSLTISHKKNDIIVSVDESPRPDTSIEKLAKLAPAFRPNGTVTAGNSSSINDG